MHWKDRLYSGRQRTNETCWWTHSFRITFICRILSIIQPSVKLLHNQRKPMHVMVSLLFQYVNHPIVRTHNVGLLGLAILDSQIDFRAGPDLTGLAFAMARESENANAQRTPRCLFRGRLKICQGVQLARSNGSSRN